MSSNPSASDPTIYTILITGANSGLGYATSCRLIDEFLATRPQSQSLHLIITTRSVSKGKDTLSRLEAHVQKTLKRVYKTSHTLIARQAGRIIITAEEVDLTRLVTVKRLAERLLDAGKDGGDNCDRGLRVKKIDVLILNAGIGGWKGIDWIPAIKSTMTDLVYACTFPDYKLGYKGKVLDRQLVEDRRPNGATRDVKEDEEPVLGETFTANVFGHYMLAHWLMPLLYGSVDPSGQVTSERGRIIWLSSIEAHEHMFDIEDLQGLRGDVSYESSKRLTDLLVLTSELASTKRIVAPYMSTNGGATSNHQEEIQPRMYVCHPGVCGTSIAALPLIMDYMMFAAFYIARLLGSPWHTVTAYLGSVAVAWLALCPMDAVDAPDQKSNAEGGKAKWGSSTDRVGNERVIMTEVAGWGWTGLIGEKPNAGSISTKYRFRGMKDADRESRQNFEDLGRKAWMEMEAMRQDWEKRIDGA